MLVVPTQVMEDSYIPPPQMVSYSILCLFILEDWQIDLHPQTSSVSSCSVALLRHPCQVNGWELYLLHWSELPPPEEGDPLEVSLSNYGTPCLLHHLLVLPKHWQWVFFHSVLWFLVLLFLSSALEASSSKPHIHSSMLYVVVGVQLVFMVPKRHPGPLALILFSTMASAMAWWPSWTVLTIFSTWASLPAQWTGLPRWNPTSLASSRGSPCLSDHLKNKIISLGGQNHCFHNSFFQATLEHVSN